MKPALITPQLLQIAKELLDWAYETLVKDDPNIQRPIGSQAKCPFVAASLENNTFYISLHPEVNGANEAVIEQIMLSYIEQFKAQPPWEPKKQPLKALLVVFPELSESDAYVLDIVHPKIKPHFVEAGLMVGQFHKKCEERGIYNRGYRVSISPYPLIAIRHMALHDIVFLRKDEQYFPSYDARFGDRFKEPEKLEDYEKPLLNFYLEAKENFLR